MSASACLGAPGWSFAGPEPGWQVLKILQSTKPRNRKLPNNNPPFSSWASLYSIILANSRRDATQWPMLLGPWRIPSTLDSTIPIIMQYIWLTHTLARLSAVIPVTSFTGFLCGLSDSEIWSWKYNPLHLRSLFILISQHSWVEQCRSCIIHSLYMTIHCHH